MQANLQLWLNHGWENACFQQKLKIQNVQVVELLSFLCAITPAFRLLKLLFLFEEGRS